MEKQSILNAKSALEHDFNNFKFFHEQTLAQKDQLIQTLLNANTKMLETISLKQSADDIYEIMQAEIAKSKSGDFKVFKKIKNSFKVKT